MGLYMLRIPRVGVSVHLYSGKTPCKKTIEQGESRFSVLCCTQNERSVHALIKEEKRAQRSVICNEALGLDGCGRVTSLCFGRGKRLSGVIRTPAPQKMSREG